MLTQADEPGIVWVQPTLIRLIGRYPRDFDVAGLQENLLDEERV